MSLVARWKRRYAHPGIYLYRTRRHMRPGTEWGYAGKSRNLKLRDECHTGVCTRHPGCAGGKPWSDLVTRRYVLELPWWLGFDWITLSLETGLIWLARPRYNVQKNPRRDKVGPYLARQQRRMRENSAVYQERLRRVMWWSVVARTAAVLMIVTGAGGWWLTR